MFGSAQPTLLSFPLERPIFLREYAVGSYSSVSYFISKLMIELPVAFLQVLISWAVSFHMIDLQGNFLYMVMAAFLLSLASTGIAVFLGCCFTDAKTVTEMSPLVFVPQLL